MNKAASLVTPAGLQRLHTELRVLRSRQRALLAERLIASDEYGPRRRVDVDGDTVLSWLADRIAALEDSLASAEVVEPSPWDGVVGLGESVRIRDVDSGEVGAYRLVGAVEADPGAGEISYLSPLGLAVIGRRVGDVVDVQAPRSTRRVEILEIGA